MENNIFLEEDVLVCILNEAKVTLTERSDVNECIKSCICNLFVDFALLLSKFSNISGFILPRN